MSLSQRLRLMTLRVGFRSAPLAASLLGVDQLPGTGWEVLDQRAWKVGSHGSVTPAATRAGAAGLVTVWRSFGQNHADRWLWVQVAPLLSSADAAEAFDNIDAAMVGNVRSRAALLRTDDISAPDVAQASAVRAIEHVSQTDGDESSSRSLVCTKASSLIVLTATSFGAAWPWPDVASLTATQLARLPD